MSGGGHWQRSSEEVLSTLATLEKRMRCDYAESLELIAELAVRNVAAEVGYSSLAVLLRDVMRISTSGARRRLGHVDAVTDVPMVSGGVAPAPLPVTATALREGALGADHVDVIAKTLRGLPLHVPDADREAAERTMVDAARSLDARTLAKVGERVRAVLDQDGTPPDDREPDAPACELHLSTKRNGRIVIRGEFDQESSALIAAVISPLARPRPSDDTGPDQRTTAERQGDALVEVLRLAADTGSLPGEGGEKPHLLVTIPLQTLRDGIGHAALDGVGHVSAAGARRIACDARIIPAVLGSRSEPLDLGRAAYVVPTAIRRALILRDHGCAFPGCDRSYRWCHSHHVRHWADGGPTELDSLVLLCGRHHRLIHHSPWDCEIRNGQPEFRPPAFVDATRTPRHNLLRARVPAAG